MKLNDAFLVTNQYRNFNEGDILKVIKEGDPLILESLETKEKLEVCLMEITASIAFEQLSDFKIVDYEDTQDQNY